MIHFFHNRVLYGMIYSYTILHRSYSAIQEPISNHGQKRTGSKCLILVKAKPIPLQHQRHSKEKNNSKQQQQWQFHTATTIKQALLLGLLRTGTNGIPSSIRRDI